VSRTGSTEYQLHLMKVSDRDRNVNKNKVSFLVVFLVKVIIKQCLYFRSADISYQPHFGLMTLPQIAVQLGRGHRELKYPYYGYFSSRCSLQRRPKQGKHVLDFS